MGAPEVFLPQQTAHPPDAGGTWHRLAHQVGDTIGWQTFLLAGAVGLVVLFRKKVGGFFK